MPQSQSGLNCLFAICQVDLLVCGVSIRTDSKFCLSLKPRLHIRCLSKEMTLHQFAFSQQALGT